MKDNMIYYKSELKLDFEKIVTSYVVLFCQKQGFPLEDAFWVSDAVGTILCVGDFFFNLEDIRYDIDNNVEPEKIMQWQEYCIEANYKSEPVINFAAFNLLNQ